MSAEVDTPDIVDPVDLVDPMRFAERGYPQATWAKLRAEAPVKYLEPEGYEPFWAVTKHAGVGEVSAQPVLFSSAHGLILGRLGSPGQPVEMVVTVDPPRHGPLRRVAMRRFTPKAIRERRQEIDRIAAEILSEVAEGGDGAEFDFVERVAAPFPIAVISWTLGVPRQDWRLLFGWTNEVIGKDDPEFRRPGETPGQTLRRARGELHAYLDALVAERRRSPRDDIVSQLVSAEVDGEPLTPEQILNYCELMVEAGNETTRNAISGGLLAFSENPDEWARLHEQRELIPDAVEEILRWVSPIVHFTRTAMADTELQGRRIRQGDKLALFYASANRDEDVFADPFTFRVDRRPNSHLAFGSGEHFCMGAHLARLEIETIFTYLLDHLDSFELVGSVERLNSAVNGGFKHVPIRCRFR